MARMTTVERLGLTRLRRDLLQSREQQGQKRRPLLVALTGWGQDEDRRRSEEAGFDAHWVKPVDDAVLGRRWARENGAETRDLRDRGSGDGRTCSVAAAEWLTVTARFEENENE